jgi:uncharacterized protein YjlB
MELDTWQAPPGETIPNNPTFPVLIYHGVDVSDPRGLFAEHGWGGSWTGQVFQFHHFHSTSHEVLAVIEGHATIQLGGPQGAPFDAAVGDVLVLPAGTGHYRTASGGDFTVVGAYPHGQEDYDLLREADDAARERIARLGPPPQDPVGGDGVALWTNQEAT